MTLGTFRSPLALKKGGTGIKVPLKKGDLGGSKTFDTGNRTFQTSSKSREQGQQNKNRCN
ncbi:hypothetical protein GJB62_02235 [Nostoc sp. ATCC 53789]|nr:hypothetical protein GJB62_02235 [Nostoc sp. ATCC 53789]QLE48459.1 hypothetical protein FD724_10270 [Nostoc sp. C057]